MSTSQVGLQIAWSFIHTGVVVRPRYQYHALSGGSPSNIRLLTLEPSANEDDPIRAQLAEVTLERNTDYVALSYVWGTGAPSHDITIEGRQLSIRRNLLIALRSLRASQRLTIWADAVCINQEDLQERASQVSMMREIYESATEVVIHLGGISSVHCVNADKILRSLILLARRFSPLIERCIAPWAAFEALTHSFHEVDVFNLPQYGLPEMTDPLWKSFVRLLEHPWFNRVWVVQESLVARHGTIIWGGLHMRMQPFLEIIQWALWIPGFINAIDRRPGAMSKLSRIKLAMYRCALLLRLRVTGEVLPWRKVEIMHLLSMIGDSQATDPRDFVFALRGISLQVDEPALIPDCTKSTEQVYSQLAKFLIQHGHGPAVLHFCHKAVFTVRHAVSQPAYIPVYHGTDLPSWIPRWDVREGRGFFPVYFEASVDDRFNAAGSSVQKFRVSQSGQELIVKASLLSRICELGTCVGSPKTDEDVQTGHLFHLYMKCVVDAVHLLDKSDKYNTGELDFEIIAILLVFDQWKETEEWEGRKVTARQDSGPSHFASWMRHQFQQLENGLVPEAPEWMSEYRTAVIWAMKRLQIPAVETNDTQIPGLSYRVWLDRAESSIDHAIRCLTSDGYLCQVPKVAEVGDQIALIAGLRVPCLLRPWFNGTYSFVGECYVHGVMYGELWDEGSCQSIRIV